MRLVGESVIGLTIIPLSERFTRSTSDACSSIDRFLWMTPMPPCCAIAIASRDSVTVSIAALSSGTFTRMLRVTRDDTSTALGSTCECRGTSSTSSNVSAVERPMAIWSEFRTSVLVSIQVPKKKGSDPSAALTVPGRASRRSSAMTLLIFLPAAARTRVVASDFRLVALAPGVTTSSPPVRAGRGASCGRRRRAAPTAPNGDGAEACGEFIVICCGGRRGGVRGRTGSRARPRRRRPASAATGSGRSLPRSDPSSP